MSVMHCPLCVGLAVLSIVRAAAHVGLVWIALNRGGVAPVIAWGDPEALACCWFPASEPYPQHR